MTDKRAQGALEYLLLIGGAVVIGSIVIVLMLGTASTGNSQTQSSLNTADSAKTKALYGFSLPPGTGYTDIAGIYGTATFTPTTDVISLSSSTIELQQWTMMARVYDTKNATNYKAIIQVNSTSDDALYIYPDGSNRALGFWPCSFVGSVPKNQWTHVAATYDSSGFKYYINGALTGSGATCPNAVHWQFLRIGGIDQGDVEKFEGTIKDVLVLKKALTPSQVQSFYTSNYS